MSVRILRGDHRRFEVTIGAVVEAYLPDKYGDILRERLVAYLLARAEWRHQQADEDQVKREYALPAVLAETNEDDRWYENASQRLENAEKQAAAAAVVANAETALTNAETVLRETLFPGTWRIYTTLETAYSGGLATLTADWIRQQPEEAGWVGNMDWKCRVSDGRLEIALYS